MFGRYVRCLKCEWVSRTVAFGSTILLAGYTCCPKCGAHWLYLRIITGQWKWKGSILNPFSWFSYEFEERAS